MAGDAVLFHLLAEFQTVHHGHHHVRHDKVGHMLACHVQSRFAVLGLQHTVFALKDGLQIGADIGIVIDDEHRGRILVGLDISSRFGRREILRLYMGIDVGNGAAHLGIQHLVDEAGKVMSIAANDSEEFTCIVACSAEVVGP